MEVWFQNRAGAWGMANDLNGHFSKENMQMTNDYEKCSILQIIQKIKIKQK